MEYLLYYMPSTPSKIWKDKQNTANFGHNTSFFHKNLTITYLTTIPNEPKSFYITFIDIFF